LGIGSQLVDETNKFSQELRLSSSIGQWLDWLVGGFYTHENAPISHENFTSANPATGTLGDVFLTYVETPYRFSEEAIFSDLTVHFTDRFNVQLGGRESWYNQVYQETYTGPGAIDYPGHPSPYVAPELHATGSAFTYLVTPQFKISPETTAYARVASGYRIGGPNSSALIYPGTPSEYKPDRTTNYEIGIKGDYLEHRLSVDVAAYYISWHDFQLKVLQDSFNQFTTNAGDAKSEGVELSVQAHPVTGLTIQAEGSFNDAALTQDLPAAAVAAGAYAVAGDRLPYSIRWSGGITANQDFPLWRGWTGFVGGAFDYVGLRYAEFASSSTSPRIQMPAYSTLNLRMGALHELWLFNLFVNNVGDRRGIVGGFAGAVETGNADQYAGTVIQPRTVGLSVARSFR